MALIIRKFLSSRIILSAAVFISLSGVTNGEPRTCYWCGPLAEQVHRSQRAPPCNGATEVTVCDPGFPYCAIVATAPPYVESRYCVKLYQDECYPLYCNSTRTWRMTCPCRGDLCNGPETDREHDAFAVLAKLVARTQNTRIKRSLISPLHLVNIDTHTQSKVNIDENKTNNVTIEESNLVNIELAEANTVENLTNTQVDIINGTFSLTDVVQIGVPEPDDDGITTTESAVNQNPVVTMTDMNGNNDVSSKSNVQSYSPYIENSYPRTEIIIMSSETPEIMTRTSTIFPVITTVPDNNLVTINSTIPTTVIEKNYNDMAKLSNKDMSNEKLPPAEALQHNEMPTVKSTEVTISTTHKVMTTQHSLTTMKTYKSQNNTAIKVDAHLVVLFIGIILQN